MGRRLLAFVAAMAVLTGCGQVVAGTPKGESFSDDDRTLITEYFDRNNEAAGEGASAQREFLASTQHPDFDDDACNLGELTLTIAPTLSTLRPDAGWQPLNTNRTPRGRIYIIAVAVTVQRGNAPVGVQIGSIHVVVLDGKAHGFAPCPA